MSDTPSGSNPNVASSKKRKGAGGRPELDNIWQYFDKVDPPKDQAVKWKRNFNAKCHACKEVVTGKPAVMRQHLSHCDQAPPSDQMDADRQTADAAASSISQAEQPHSPPKGMRAYLDKNKISKTEKQRLWVLLALAFVVCGWSFRMSNLLTFCKICVPTLLLQVSYSMPDACMICLGQLCQQTCSKPSHQHYGRARRKL